MRTFIDINLCCSTGLSIIVDKVDMFHNYRAVIDLRKREREHLPVCSVCNPELLVGQLWPDVRVSEERTHDDSNPDSLFFLRA